ncbi:ubiquinol-cytochrome-c reductase complex assembly factor 1-like isoform X4 [Wyeomyia smithii]|nr:ubiquinol-cytochrome-c reductase complex assembly factor 1-like isoform X4 [Wyeomyia smithii]
MQEQRKQRTNIRKLELFQQLYPDCFFACLSPGSGRSDDLEERLKKLPDIGSEKIPLLLAGERVQSVPTQATQDLHLLKSPSRPLQTRLALLSTETARAYPAATGTNQTSVSAETEGGFLKRFIKTMGWLDNSKVRLRMSSCYLYESVADCVNYNEFFTYFNMPNSFSTWFLITELHVWMLLVRAMAEGPEKDAAGRFMRNCIVETMWNDVTTRVKQLAADNPSAVRPQIQLLSEQFQATLMAYDEGISSDDKVLSGALWRRFFSSRCEDYEHLELLVKYVRRQMEMLDKTDRYNFAIKPTVKWLPLIEKPGL